MGWGAGENGSGSLPWGAHREGVLLVTEMTFTESWPALQSSRAPPPTLSRSPQSDNPSFGFPSPRGLCSGKWRVGLVLPWLLSSPRLSTQITTTHPCACALSSEYSALPTLCPQWSSRPSIFGKHGKYSPAASLFSLQEAEASSQQRVRLGLGQCHHTPASLQPGPRGHAKDICTA